MLEKHEQLDANLRTRIAAINGLQTENINNKELGTLYNEDGNPLNEKYTGKTYRDPCFVQRKQQLDQLTEALFDLPIVNWSYGIFSPSYEIGLQQQKAQKSQETPHKALLIGALTQDTIHEYAQTVDRVYPDSKRFVVDIKGIDTPKVEKKIAQFIFGSGINLPFKEGSIDSVHTNILTPHLINTTIPDPRLRMILKGFAFPTVAHEMQRVLKPGGVAIMVEKPRHSERTAEALEDAGLKVLLHEPAIGYTKRRAMEIDRFDKTTKHLVLPTNCNVIYARK